MRVVFVQTDFFYQPYTDFFNLVQLSGYETCKVSEMDVTDSNVTYIVSPMNGEWKHGWSNPKSRIIWWDLEWGGYDEPQLLPEGVSERWASCPHYAKVSGAKYVVLGSHPNLVYVDNINPLIPYSLRTFEHEVSLMAYREPHRRRVLIGQLQAVTTIAPDGWGVERDYTLRNVQAMVHIHQHERGLSVAPIRLAIAAAYRLPVICEEVFDRGIYKDTLFFAKYEAIPATVNILVDNPDLLIQKSIALHRLLCEQYTFRQGVELAL